jgi:hypothetical protein
VTLGWRRLSPSAELFVDPESGKRCAVRDPGALGAERYYWNVPAFCDHQVTAGRTGNVREARSQAEAALAGYMAAWRELSGKRGARTPKAWLLRCSGRHRSPGIPRDGRAAMVGSS